MKLPDLLAVMMTMLLLSSFLLYMGVRGLKRGEINHKMRIYRRATDPVGFWFHITVLFATGAILLVFILVLSAYRFIAMKS